MKRLLLVVCLLLSTIASAGDYLTVTGSGKTFEEAKQQAFRKAIEFKVGATVLSDVETKNYQRVKDEIYIYSAGYVDDYKVLKQENTDNNVVVLLDVLVSENKLKNRILSVGKSGTDFNGQRHSAQVSTYIQEQQQGDRLLSKVLSGYPTKAFKIRQNPYNIVFDFQRNPVIEIPYELSWNVDFLLSLRETLSTIQDCVPAWSKACVSAVNILVKDPKDIFTSRSDHYFNDTNRYNQIHNTFVENSPRLVIRMYDIKNNYLYGTCYTPKFVWGGSEGFYSTSSHSRGLIYGNIVERGNISIRAPVLAIDRTEKIEITVEAKDICKN